jgi:hypothetical protein
MKQTFTHQTSFPLGVGVVMDFTKLKTLKEITNKANKVTHWTPIRGGIEYINNLQSQYVADTEQKVFEDYQDIQDWDFSDYELAQNVVPGKVYNLPPNAVIIENSEDGTLFAVSFE